MTGRLLLLLLLGVLAAGCVQKVETPQGAMYLRSCDDGGEKGGAGGVIIDGVCL